jgi:hypothetical protein
MGEIRARKVAGILAGLGVVLETVVVNTSAEAVKADGVNGPCNRRVVLVVVN